MHAATTSNEQQYVLHITCTITFGC